MKMVQPVLTLVLLTDSGSEPRKATLRPWIFFKHSSRVKVTPTTRLWAHQVTLPTAKCFFSANLLKRLKPAKSEQTPLSHSSSSPSLLPSCGPSCRGTSVLSAWGEGLQGRGCNSTLQLQQIVIASEHRFPSTPISLPVIGRQQNPSTAKNNRCYCWWDVGIHTW